jgi:hypothetical protein
MNIDSSSNFIFDGKIKNEFLPTHLQLNKDGKSDFFAAPSELIEEVLKLREEINQIKIRIQALFKKRNLTHLLEESNNTPNTNLDTSVNEKDVITL